VENVADLACRTALTYRGVAHVTMPLDIQEMPASRRGSRRNVPHHTSDAAAYGGRLPASADLARAAEVLNAGRKVAILAGRGALGATDAPGPVVVEALVDPFEPPLPAKVTLEQATKFARSLLRGEPNRERIALTVLSDRVRELV
jgi:pyruvate dehydrogenase (quinone)/pyruvate oxidase